MDTYVLLDSAFHCENSELIDFKVMSMIGGKQ